MVVVLRMRRSVLASFRLREHSIVSRFCVNGVLYSRFRSAVDESTPLSAIGRRVEGLRRLRH